MLTEVLWISAGCVLLSALATGVIRRASLSAGTLDIPNQRSSHSIPTPRGGGAAVVLSVTAAAIVLASLGILSFGLLMALVVGGVAVAAIGFLDDRRPVRAGVRFAIHLGAALWAVAWLGGMPVLQVGEHLIPLGWAGAVLAVLAIVWTLNLFNFMDGIDGIAGSEAVFVAGAGALLSLLHHESLGVVAAGGAFCAATLGFLGWNWPPAKIFMGDVGSGYLGFFIAVSALAASRDHPADLWAWLILGGAFFVDATVTLVRRAIRGERVYEAHRSHAYQRLARKWHSHRRVTVATVLVNCLWLLPCALLATLYPAFSLTILTIALAPLVVVVILAGAGTPD
jgi:Fuc2NAc and GlcNAc transferase